MKKPAIIDQEIEFTIYSHAMITPPMEVEDYNPDDPAELIYASAMDFITEGRTEQGRKDLESAYRLGSWRAGNTLAYGLSVGWFGERDYPAHLVVLRNLVKQGSSGAMSNLGFAYEHGLGLQKSLRWAVYWYEKAVRRGSVDAMANLANIFLFREGKYNNVERGAYLALMAADLGGETAMNELGLCYEHGLGVPRCEDKVFEWFTKAVENGAGACAEHNLARCYRKGIGTKVDKEKAEEWDRIAAEHGWKKHTKSEQYDSGLSN